MSILLLLFLPINKYNQNKTNNITSIPPHEDVSLLIMAITSAKTELNMNALA